jgi:pimeloyl-ACP methyl ester carboxylesterase
MQFHRAYRQLGLHLSRAGFPVLRFDFLGCGDSAGNAEETKIDQWLVDISRAVSEMKRRSHVARVCLVGLRLGGALSMIAGAERRDISGMVLWDPVLHGTAYVEKLTTLHQRMLRLAHVIEKDEAKREKPSEILGFPYTESLLVDIENLDLLSIGAKPAENILVIQSDEETDQRQLKKNLESMGSHVDFLHFPTPQIWTWIEDFGKVVVPYEILQSVISWLCEAYP